MGATNNKPLKSDSSHRQRGFDSRNTRQKRTENEDNYPQVQYYSESGNSDAASSRGDQNQAYNNAANFDFRPSNVSTINTGHDQLSNFINFQYPNTEYNHGGPSSEYPNIKYNQGGPSSEYPKIEYSQGGPSSEYPNIKYNQGGPSSEYHNIKYNQGGPSSDYSLLGKEENSGQSYFNRNSIMCKSQEVNYDRSNLALFIRDSYGNLDLESNQSDEHMNVLNVLSYPPAWSSNSVNKTGFVDVPSTSVEGEKLHRFFYKTSRTREFQLLIVGIERIENPFLHTLYLLKKEEMRVRNEHVDELHLYHGTKSENISKICEDNFNWRLFSEKHKFGMGISFSPFAFYSSHYSDDNDEKVMLLLKVLVSNAVCGTPEMEIPPIVDDVTYDTSIKEDTTVIVKYSDNEFYPLYKITYKKLPL